MKEEPGVSQEDAEIAALKLENDTLAQQVKRLVKAESKLYEYQEELDSQLKEYKELYELNRKLNATFDIQKIFESSIEYVINNLEFERVLFFRDFENTGNYAVCASGGYYDLQEESCIAKLTIRQDASFLSPLLAGGERLICAADSDEKDLAGYREKLLMNEYLIYPISSHARPLVLLAVGNSAENAEFYRRVSESEGALLGMGNLVGLLSSMIENRIFYANLEKALEQERLAEAALQELNEELEARVLQRTSELSAANERLRQRNLEASVLYKVSSVISQSLNMDKMLGEVLNTISRLEVFELGSVREGEIFIVEGDRMKLMSHLGHSDSFLNLHKDMKVGDCLCGAAAKTGEIIISTNSEKDIRHTFALPGMPPHGHLILPLKTKDRVEGVLDLYMPVDFNIDEDTRTLLLSIGNQLGIAIENAKLYEKTKALSLQDPLTGLWNHEEILRILGQELVRAKREGTSVGVIMADLDFFKKVNDTYGHMAGDAVLRLTAGRLISTIRPYDAIGRYGGEEFMVVLPGCDDKCTLMVAERLRKCIAGESMDTPEGAIPVTVSIGLATGSKINCDLNSLVKAADSALYQAKKHGRNRVQAAPKTVSEYKG